MRIIFKKACVFNRHARKVGMITNVEKDRADDLISAGLADQYFGEYPPRGKTKINLKDLR